MEQAIQHYRELIASTRRWMSCNLSEIDNHILGLLFYAYASSMETVYREYNKASFFSKCLWKKRLKEQFKNIDEFRKKFINVKQEVKER